MLGHANGQLFAMAPENEASSARQTNNAYNHGVRAETRAPRNSRTPNRPVPVNHCAVVADGRGRLCAQRTPSVVIGKSSPIA